MRFIRIILPRRPQSTPVAATKTPLSYVRRRYYYLGDEYGVQVARGERNGLKIDDHMFIVTLCEMTHENFDNYILAWYRRKARLAFEMAVDRWLPLLEELGYTIPRPRLKLFQMRRAWGRCYYSKGLITINLHLIKMPHSCFDYIVLHELCHFVHQNHSPKFKALVAQVYPQWRDCDSYLKESVRTQVTILQRLHK